MKFHKRQMSNPLFNQKLVQAMASQYGLRLGAVWLCSFACTMYALDVPFLGTLGNFLGLFSIVMGARMIRTYRIQEHDLSWPQSLWFALTFFLFAALLTTLGQYIYFAFIDKGHFLHIISSFFDNPLYAESMKQSFPELDVNLLLETFASMSSKDIIMQFLFMNLMATGACALLSSLFGGLGKLPVQPENKITE